MKNFEPKPAETEQNIIPNLPEEYNTATITRVETGVSTYVYKLERPEGISYLRINKHNDNVAAEVQALKTAVDLNVHVPHIEYVFESPNEQESSYMIVSEIPGTSLEDAVEIITPEQHTQILHEAGKELAQLHTMAVEGFGPLETKELDPEHLVGKDTSYQEFMCPDFDKMLHDIQMLSILDVKTEVFIQNIWNKYQELLKDPSLEMVLSHGDFDISHIYTDNGQYTGMIDFGDVCAASPTYDLAHFRLFDQENFEDLLSGYLPQSDLPSDYQERIEFEALLIALKKLHKRVTQSWGSQIIAKRQKLLEYISSIKHLTTKTKNP